MTRELNLILHCGASHVTREELTDTLCPAATETHFPIPHIKLVDELERQLKEYGYKVGAEAFGATHDGMRAFGMMQLVGNNDEFAFVVGWRNSHDKTMPARVGMGASMFVCDNMAFSSEVDVMRKHTRNVLRDLPRKIGLAVGRFGALQQRITNQYDAYKSHALTDAQGKALICEAVKQDVIGCKSVIPVLEAWENPPHDEYAEMNLWRLFNAVTETAKTWKPNVALDRTRKLHTLCDAVSGLTVEAVDAEVVSVETVAV